MKKKILVIEDEQEIRRDITKILSLNGYDVYQAENGAEGIKMALMHLPDLIISDIMMPEIDGFGVLKELQKSPQTNTIPFIFLSAKSARNDIREGMNLGADDYITKPFDFDEILEAVKKRLEKIEKTEKKYSTKYEALAENLRNYLPHEIRTPLNVILGLSDFLRKNYDHTTYHEAREMLQNINDSAKRLQRLFENYLFYANLELTSADPKDVEAIKRKHTPLAEHLLRDIVVYSAGNAGRTNDIELELEEGSVAIPENYFMKIVEEVLDNAYKFSERGKPIKIRTNTLKGYYFIHITDYGRGMSQEQINNIGAHIQFERRIHEQQGAGLGLAIVKAITKLVGGELIIKSEPNVFTTVSIKLPLAKIDLD